MASNFDIYFATIQFPIWHVFFHGCNALDYWYRFNFCHYEKPISGYRKECKLAAALLEAFYPLRLKGLDKDKFYVTCRKDLVSLMVARSQGMSQKDLMESSEIFLVDSYRYRRGELIFEPSSWLGHKRTVSNVRSWIEYTEGMALKLLLIHFPYFIVSGKDGLRSLAQKVENLSPSEGAKWLLENQKDFNLMLELGHGPNREIEDWKRMVEYWIKWLHDVEMNRRLSRMFRYEFLDWERNQDGVSSDAH